MVSLFILNAFSFSIFIAGTIAVVRYNKINKSFYPLLFCIWIACINEVISFILVEQGHKTVVNNNIYVFIEALLITLLFKNLGLFRNKTIFYVIIFAIIIEWVTENLILGKISAYSIYFRIFYSFIISLMSISTVNRLIAYGTKRMLVNPVFLICLSFIIYFVFKVLIYTFWIYGLSKIGFLQKVSSIIIYINLFTNLIYALSVLCMPKKIEYSLPY
ncbi:MAG: hypothetical protein JWO92_731 [Chitinophagaceae bacterium]|nr:hypothetical protein [Chitinophagaceae bacterium]MDB5223388.1 hypothetical protein [Chitinophagaceae bacterium]